jgi:hypothetical protein
MDNRQLNQRIKEEIIKAMKERCIEQGHEWENGCTVFFEIVKICKWCGERVLNNG